MERFGFSPPCERVLRVAARPFPQVCCWPTERFLAEPWLGDAMA